MQPNIAYGIIDFHMDEFEKMLSKMSKPEVTELRHQAMLADQIIKTKHKAALSWWWLGIPVYILLAFIMKSFYAPGSSLKSSLAKFAETNGLLAWSSFVAFPTVLIIINGVSVYKLAIMNDGLRGGLLKALIYNLAAIVLSIIVMAVFLINK